MSLIKSLAGTLAVIFSIQPLAAWAANPTKAQQGPTNRTILIPKNQKQSTISGHSNPTCGGDHVAPKKK